MHKKYKIYTGDGKMKKKIRIKFINWIDAHGNKRVVMVGKNF
ncbi:hypothetical protein [Clostridium peptidivorans]|nr:hypothetical protein [Clostridium peptidivorans]